ncbi:hypothetical protein [Spirosoma pollinicola]|uniref:Uncharacterized protein n=1 Tax=Spirosoma pollinicola TaxID=2057025 RepID=A0A2K8YTI1_9BACT|nr:hypothetical protein [Spirosoma pollinicola]AUD00933.1 hypothetical protein CWM47_03345 [Spirosoma pollinicola]
MNWNSDWVELVGIFLWRADRIDPPDGGLTQLTLHLKKGADSFPEGVKPVSLRASVNLDLVGILSVPHDH